MNTSLCSSRRTPKSNVCDLTSGTTWSQQLPPSPGKNSNFYHISLKYCLQLNKRRKKIRRAQQVRLIARLGHTYFMWLHHHVAHGKSPALARMDLHHPEPQGSRTRFSRIAAQIHHLQLRGPVLMGARGFNCFIIQPLTEGREPSTRGCQGWTKKKLLFPCRSIQRGMCQSSGGDAFKNQ